MTQYRIPELDLATRMEIATEMMRPAPERGWGLVTDYARQYDVSRQCLYGIRDQAREGMETALLPEKPGPKTPQIELVVDRQFIKRAAAIMSVMPNSIRGIQSSLELLLGVQRSVGYISETLQQAGRAAEAMNAKLETQLPVLAEADEIFQGGRPCLTVVDGRTFLVLNLAAADSRDADHWGMTFLELSERGIDFQDVVSDGARGIRAGVQAADLGVPVHFDLFHLLQRSHPITRRLERQAYEAMKITDRAQRAAHEQARRQRRRGRPLTVKLSLEEAQARAQEAVDTYDLWCWLLWQVRRSLEPITSGNQFTSACQTRDTIQAAAALMHDLDREDIRRFAQALLDHLDDLLAPLEWLDVRWQPWLALLDPDDHAFILWAWRHHLALDLCIDVDFPDHLQPAVQVFWTIMPLFHRASSLAESLHSWLRPHLMVHRGMPQWLLPLLQLFWNNHCFQRGKRAGASPLQLAGDTDAPTLANAFHQLFPTSPATDAYSLDC